MILDALVTADFFRSAAIGLGGLVVGGGSMVLFERARFYDRHDLVMARRAMLLLLAVNALVLTFVAAVLIDRWGDEATWRLGAAFLIFMLKGWFFLELYRTGMEQERRALRSGERSWLEV